MFVVYYKDSTIYATDKQYKTKAAAKAARTRIANKTGVNSDTIGVMDAETFKVEVEQWVVRTNTMTGEEYSEAINTPRCVSPSSELYWAM